MKTLKLLFVITILLISCNKKGANNSDKIVENDTLKQKTQEEDGLTLFKQTCYACHSVTTQSHDEIIAPPMAVVKMRYKMRYPTEKEFVNAMVNYATDPKEEKALMQGAVQQFKVMPHQNFDQNNLRIIATYIYNNKLEKPKWFDEHFMQQHPNGMGMGKGMGSGRMNNQ